MMQTTVPQMQSAMMAPSGKYIATIILVIVVILTRQFTEVELNFETNLDFPIII